MKANTANLLQFLKNAGILEIPVYQRNYSWSLEQCAQLWSDISSLARNENIKNHFMGVIVYVEKGISQISSTNRFYLIDGQQRLTTISLILSALDEFIDVKKYLFNINENGKNRYKLYLNNEDKATFISIIEKKEDLPRIFSAQINENYNFFKKAIKESKISPLKLINALSRLTIIDVALEKDNDNPQLIFDSLNSTGLALSQSSQIKNLLLMGIDRSEQEDIYNDYLKPLEELFANNKEFDRFISDYLTIQNNGSIPKLNQLYSAFNAFFAERLRFQTRKEIAKHLFKYAKYFKKLTTANFDDIELKENIRDLNTLEAYDSYPFLMEVMEDFENELINKDIFIDILKSVENYVLKRAIDETEEQLENKTFSNLSKDINEMLALRVFTPKIVKKPKGVSISDITAQTIA
ncbi:MAG: DUF262 domain-containing protein [Candidatus Gastranaerophilales bacterium]|nr:DUF262 domain-containing protein [Candidatus Gastranaerophilales bacterium]